MIRFSCPTCKSVLQCPADKASEKIACPKCGQRLLIPNPVKPVASKKTALGEPLPSSHNSFSKLKSDDRTLKINQWAMFIHFSLLAGYILPVAGWVLPIILWQIKKHEMPEIDAHGKNVCNWLLTEVLHSIILIAIMIPAIFFSILPPIGCIVLILGVLCIPLLVVVHVLSIVYPIIGGIKANDGRLWVYPGTHEFLK